jgi:hypothetical protein
MYRDDSGENQGTRTYAWLQPSIDNIFGRGYEVPEEFDGHKIKGMELRLYKPASTDLERKTENRWFEVGEHIDLAYINTFVIDYWKSNRFPKEVVFKLRVYYRANRNTYEAGKWRLHRFPKKSEVMGNGDDGNDDFYDNPPTLWERALDRITRSEQRMNLLVAQVPRLVDIAEYAILGDEDDDGEDYRPAPPPAPENHNHNPMAGIPIDRLVDAVIQRLEQRMEARHESQQNQNHQSEAGHPRKTLPPRGAVQVEGAREDQDHNVDAERHSTVGAGVPVR